jgi:hypothetical protein
MRHPTSVSLNSRLWCSDDLEFGKWINFKLSMIYCQRNLTEVGVVQWTKIEALTGLWTGDDWDNNRRGKQVVSVK